MANRISATNKSPLVEIIVWLLLALSAFAYVVRGVVKVSRRALLLQLDDFLISGSLVFCIAQSVATVIRTSHGFGKPIGHISQQKIDTSLKAELAADIFYIISILLAKLSLISLLVTLTPNRKHQIILFALSVFLVTWSIVSVLVVAFECRTPNSWDYIENTCINRTIWWIIFDVCNIMTEVVLISIPLYIIRIVQWPLQKKILFSIPFTMRIITIAGCIADIVVWKNFVQPSSDAFFAEWQVAITTQVIQCSCLCSTCLLYLKSFLSSVETGFGLDFDLRSTGTGLATSSYHNLSNEGLTTQLNTIKRKEALESSSRSRSDQSDNHDMRITYK